MPHVAWSLRAEAQLTALVARIIDDANEQTARRWLARLRNHLDDLAEAPLGGTPVPRHPRLRETYFRRFRLTYRPVADGLQVLSLRRGRMLRRPTDLESDESL